MEEKGEVVKGVKSTWRGRRCKKMERERWKEGVKLIWRGDRKKGGRGDG